MVYCERCNLPVSGKYFRSGYCGWKVQQYLIGVACEKCGYIILDNIRVNKNRFEKAIKIREK